MQCFANGFQRKSFFRTVLYFKFPTENSTKLLLTSTARNHLVYFTKHCNAHEQWTPHANKKNNCSESPFTFALSQWLTAMYHHLSLADLNDLLPEHSRMFSSPAGTSSQPLGPYLFVRLITWWFSMWRTASFSTHVWIQNVFMNLRGGSRIPCRTGTPTLGGAQTYDFAKFSEKLHEIEKISGHEGGRCPSEIRHWPCLSLHIKTVNFRFKWGKWPMPVKPIEVFFIMLNIVINGDFSSTIVTSR